MYNRYLEQFKPDEPEPIANINPVNEQKESAFCEKTGSGLLDGLTKRMGKIKLDTDTLILIAIIWFILQENGETQIDTELLVVLGILLFMGL